jgi:hypothetical protein
MMMEALASSETWALTRATWRNITEDDILHSHRRGNLNSYKASAYSSSAAQTRLTHQQTNSLLMKLERSAPTITKPVTGQET